ncbi:hypothetical protein PV05_07216 [Exophiala xenobiotica]|uniref:BED-type domain-containing protein n=1 Tax=Exophiala xenobiotica TaxID=348802 RepID=A0A0D2EJN6_9EURO|nr:uncharacterized protein PV05_07216 [Exophiala xenobiotica]KIW54885.1 hypothetical protein PV05_07216 [Exophiala xenobiotica]
MMGGPGSGGYKNKPGDTETHSAWDIIPQDPTGTQKLAQVRCKYCGREMAQHTSRQRVHLLGCQAYLDAMKEQGVETSITRQAADPAAFFRTADWTQKSAEAKAPKVLKMQEHSTAVRIQALALGEASISSERIQEITGMDPKVLAGLRRLARERGYDPSVSMQLKEEYVLDPPNNSRPRGRPKKRKPEDDVDPALTNMQDTTQGTPTFTPTRQASNLPPGQWDFMAATPSGYTMT